MKDYYLVLGVSRTETPSGIRSAFRDLARRHHPDVAGPDSTPAFRELLEAYETLSDPAARRAYDRALGPEARPRSHPGAARNGPAGGVSLFARPQALRPSAEALLDRVLRNFTGAAVPKSERPEPLVCDVRLSPEEARRGGLLPIRIPLLAPCPACHGAGWSASFACPACDASGWWPDEAVVELALPRGVRSGSALDVPLTGLGIANLWLHVRVHVDAGG